MAATHPVRGRRPLPAGEFEADARRWLSDALPELTHDAPGVLVRTSVDEGGPAGRLLERTRPADLLVLGNRGRGAFAATLVGSVALRCAHHARCPWCSCRSRLPDGGADPILTLFAGPVRHLTSS